MEEDVLDFWQRAETFKKSIIKNAPKGNFIFNDGPPFITGLPHYATLLPSIAKDVVPRYWTMKGYRVERVWGWDCHGLPAENKVEEQLELKNKKDIEELGVDKFVDACRSYVNKGTEQWEWYINRIGRWVDIKNAYKTMDLKFMESVIWSFKKLYDMNFIYEGYRTSLHCPRCATPLSKFEITMDEGSYRDVTEKSVVVKFKIKNSSNTNKNIHIDDNTYLLAWTTTPWTLPGNLALAVGNEIDYYILETNTSIGSGIIDGELKTTIDKYIVASDRLEDLIKQGNCFSDNKKKIKGKHLVGLKYEPIYNLNNNEIIKSDKTYKVYAADFVTAENGTGIVHIAPNFGEDDFRLGEKVKLPMINLMDENGVYLESSGQWNGYYFKKANRDVLLDLEKRGIIFSSFDFTHTYPFCYRCNTPLIYKTQKAWYLNVQKIKERMLETNKEINWVPKYFKEGRFKNNIESAPDWCLSRSRYWGSPIPVWKCSNCNKIKVLGSIEEIEKLSGEKVEDLHRPNIDKYELKCECGNVMKRVKEILDCWFESGVMPFAQFHYPFEKQENFKNMFPADFIIEYTGQLRGWFYYLHVLSNTLFNSISFKNVIVSGVLAGTDGRKMSKLFGNYPDPRATLEKYGSDALRIYFMNSPIMLGDDTNFSEIDIQDALRKNIIIFWNVVKFYELFMLPSNKIFTKDIDNKENILDIWILTRLNQLIKEVTENLEKYNLPEASRPISKFIDDLSTWYLRRSRDRFKSEDEKDKQAALSTTKFILTELAKVMAPFAPFIAEQVWQKITENNFKNKDRSVHLEKWPEIINLKTKKFDNILEEMEQVRNVIEFGLAKRDKAGIKVRQPLEKFSIFNFQFSINENYLNLIKDELNVKNIVCEKGDGNISVELDTNITSELKLEGIKREIVRFVNVARKDSKLSLKDRAEIYYSTDSELILNTIKTFKDKILKDTLSNEIKNIKDTTNLKDVKINGALLKLGIKKLK
ncbi:isoleucine--tRNA ligase [Patescibacteria group bacterium]|nr:isoleucine--tRNA ligase [Patescibacteria group bacterium]